MSRSAPVYLDYAASAPVRPEAAAAVAEALAHAGNASSVHAAGRAARDRIERSRIEVCALLGADIERLVFTSGGVEADNLAVTSAVAQGARRLIVSAIEHVAVPAACAGSGLPVEIWPVDARGVADLDWLRERLVCWDAADGRPFVALMLVNNETGVIQPVAQAADIVHAHGGWLHVDAVAAAGKLAIDVEALGADTLAVAGHKIGAPQGVGALAWRARVTPVRQLHGGGHERGLRSGTENTSGIAGFAAAARVALDELDGLAVHAAWRDAAQAQLEAMGCAVGGAEGPRVGCTLSVMTRGFASHLQVMALDLEGVMVSGGSACSSGKVRPSGVLAAMGWGELAGCGVRASGGWGTLEADWIRFADTLSALIDRRSARAARAA